MSNTRSESLGLPAADFAELGLTGAAGVLANWNYSMTAFFARRMQRYWQLPLQLAEVVTPHQFTEVRLDFEARLLADYAEEAERLWRIVHANDRQAPPEDYEAGILRAQEHAAMIIDQAKAQAQRILESARAQADEMIATGAKQASNEVRRRAATG